MVAMCLLIDTKDQLKRKRKPWCLRNFSLSTTPVLASVALNRGTTEDQLKRWKRASPEDQPHYY